jgi:hypothetical protein
MGEISALTEWTIFPAPGKWFVLFDEACKLLDGMNPGFA